MRWLAVEGEAGVSSTTGSAIYKKNAASEPAAVVDTVGPVAETEMVRLKDAQQPDTEADDDKVSYVIAVAKVCVG